MALITRPIHKRIQKRHRPIIPINQRVHMLERHHRIIRKLARQRVVMRRKQAQPERIRREVVQHGVRNRETVKGARASAELVEDDERVARRARQDARRLLQLDHESGVAGENVVARADARKDAVHRGQRARLGGHVAAELRHQDGHARHAKQGGFAAHVGASEEDDAVAKGAAEVDVVGDKGVVAAEGGVAEAGGVKGGVVGIVEKSGAAAGDWKKLERKRQKRGGTEGKSMKKG